MTLSKAPLHSVSDADLTAGRRVLVTASQALALLADSLNGDFTRAVGLMLGAKGRIIVSGMGKSGHVARKIAATLSSTGTPAYFVHPAEASHGDMGAIARQDLLLLLSWGGETMEMCLAFVSKLRMLASSLREYQSASLGGGVWPAHEVTSVAMVSSRSEVAARTNRAGDCSRHAGAHASTVLGMSKVGDERCRLRSGETSARSGRLPMLRICSYVPQYCAGNATFGS